MKSLIKIYEPTRLLNRALEIDTYKKKIYIYGIATTSDEKNAVIEEANEILDVENVIASILLVDNLRIQKN